MDMTIQLQVLSGRALRSQLIIYVTMRKKSSINILYCPAAQHPKHNKLGLQTDVLSYEQVSVLVQSSIPCLDQGIIDPTGTETFAKADGRGVRKKSPLIFVVFKCFKCFAVGQLANGCFFLT